MKNQLKKEKKTADDLILFIPITLLPFSIFTLFTFKKNLSSTHDRKHQLLTNIHKIIFKEHLKEIICKQSRSVVFCPNIRKVLVSLEDSTYSIQTC